MSPCKRFNPDGVADANIVSVIHLILPWLLCIPTTQNVYASFFRKIISFMIESIRLELQYAHETLISEFQKHLHILVLKKNCKKIQNILLNFSGFKVFRKDLSYSTSVKMWIFTIWRRERTHHSKCYMAISELVWSGLIMFIFELNSKFLKFSARYDAIETLDSRLITKVVEGRTAHMPKSTPK